MDSKDLFGLDSLHGNEDGMGMDDWEDVIEGEYDAFNDETFGSNAFDEDWEASHQHLASLTEAEKNVGKKQDINSINNLPNSNHSNGSSKITASLQDIFLNDNALKSNAGPNFSSGLNIPSNGHVNHVSSNLSSQLPGSSTNIWGFPIPPDSSVKPNPLNTMGNLGLGKMIDQDVALTRFGIIEGIDSRSSVKTVSQLEDEMKMLHLQKHKANMEASRLLAIQNAQAARPPGLPPPVVGFPGVRQPQMYNFNGPPPALPPQRQQTLPFNLQQQINLQKMHLEQQKRQQQHAQFVNNGAQQQLQSQLQQHHFRQNHQHENNEVAEWERNKLKEVREQEAKNEWFNKQHNKQYFNNSFRNESNQRNQHNHHNNSRMIHKNNLMGMGGRVRRDSDAEWEDWNRMRQIDEYSGLMTPSEKQWLKNIQNLQLESKDPYVDDFYYTMYQEKKSKRRDSDHLGSLGAGQLNRNNQGKEYTPPQLENSLGKLQVASVTAPRKIIDIWVVHLDPEHPTTPLQRDMRRHRHLLLYIEKMYNILMDLEDSERKIHMLPDCPTRDAYINSSKKLSRKLWQESTDSQQTLLLTMCVRKGKNLLGRLLPWLEASECRSLLDFLMKNLSLISKRDNQDGKLAVLWPAAEKTVADGDVSTILKISSMAMITSSKSFLPPIFCTKFGISVIIALLVRGEQLWQNLQTNEEWQKFLAFITSNLASIASQKLTLPSPLPSLVRAAALHQPPVHLFRCKTLDGATIKKAQDLLKELEGIPIDENEALASQINS